MNGALFLKELKQYRASFLVWALTIAGLTVITMAAMPTMLANAATLEQFMKAYPAGFMRAFSFDPSSFIDPMGFYVVYSTLYVALLGSVFSISVGAGIIAKEQTQGSADFLLAKPLTRTRIALTKIAAWLTLVVALNVITTVTGGLCLKAFAPRPWRFASLPVVSLYAALLMLAMGAVGILVSLIVRRARSMTGPAIGIVLGFYLLDAVAKITEKYEAIGWISPFKWMDLRVSVPGYGLTGWRVGLLLALAAGGCVFAVLVYRKKDILT